jgi:hypothetical protein
MTIHAQVTIGADIAPLPGSLLDVKETDTKDTNDANATKGVMLPRVRLSDLDNLYPMFGSSGSPSSEYTANKSKLDIKHTGLTVYNVHESATDSLKKGIYHWNGSKWIYADPSAWNTLGNAGTDAKVNYIGTSDNQPLVLKANKNEGLRITPGGVTVLKNVPSIPNSDAQVLVRSSVTGELGTTGAVPTKLMLVQSAELQSYAKGDADKLMEGITFNSGGIVNALSVKWKSTEVETNNLLEEQTHAAGASFEYFTVKTKGMYEVSGFMSYTPNCEYISKATTLEHVLNEVNTALAAVNVAIQKQTGSSAWVNIAATRVIWSGLSIAGVSSSATVPPIFVRLETGDKLRLAFYRPNSTFGKDHGKRVGSWGISTVQGIDVKRGIRVMLIEESE